MLMCRLSDGGTIHLLILWHQTFTSRSLNAKMKASTPDKCTRGLSTLLYFYSLLAFDAHYQDSPFIQKPEMLGALLNPTARYAEVVPRLYVYIFPSTVPASIVRRLCWKSKSSILIFSFVIVSPCFFFLFFFEGKPQILIPYPNSDNNNFKKWKRNSEKIVRLFHGSKINVIYNNKKSLQLIRSI